MSYFTVNAEYPFGIDLSRYNTSMDRRVGVDFDVIRAHEPRVSFIAMRSGASWGYQDPCFAHYLTEAQRIGVACLAYHVIYPGQSVQAQVSNLLRIANYYLDQVRLVLDLELDFGLPKRTIMQTVLGCLEELERETGSLPILYSRAGWVDQYLEVRDLPQVDWWLAQYCWRRPVPFYTPEYPCPPLLPRGVDSWLIHQTAERAPSIGAPASRYMDYDRRNSSAEV